ncbi:pericentriolar material 1 protein isoform X1 [Pantherophis guttatus]|uniref:Pericentriolar material 1 protein isoform X1 n=1 Tax=Pantherophis guttatus TaxID=94885 RepID=A0A6P9DSM3_PANGU|nr:pericentriolar material 1 protein isoform X1 [Pantherophis guttatus]XP_034298743.1 pericentriolar material 1 protein isoform X1 [Pantherophis guttatus]XP_034298746.1 pericentriolar material 1 protein isoform X1 [Pantherophis guttatus]XP_034298747.1 pericentriolar material 1 protein isoform X1 [Pantherophis guttatus]XP_034298748.1 pericentriolar material 1 protein isoform X1 [Pantherophis guttatus]
MATGGSPFEEGIDDHDLPSWSHESLDDRLNNTSWGSQPKRPNRSSEKNQKKVSAESETRFTNDISPESTPEVGRRKSKTPHTFPRTRYITQMSVPEQTELEKLKQRINFSDLDQRSIGSDSQGRATAANNKRQLNENRKPFNFLSLQINTNKGKETAMSSQIQETGASSKYKDLFTAALNKDLLQNCPVSIEEDGRGEPAVDSSQIVSRLVQIRDYIAKASSMREDLVEKNERSANVERLSHLIDHLKEQEKSYLKFLQKMLARENEEDGRTIDSAVGSGSVAESTSLNLDVQSEVSDTTEVSFSLKTRPCIEDKLGNSATQGQVSDMDVTATPKGKRDTTALNGREIWSSRINSQEPGLLSKARDPQQEATEELANLKKQHDLLKRMLQQQEQLKALKGRQAALLALHHKAEQAIAVMDDSVVTETTGSVSGVSLTSELNEELNDLIQRFHNQLHDSQIQPVPDNRRQAESLSLAREVSQSRNSSMSEQLSDKKAQLFSKMVALQDKKQKMDKLLGALHTLRDQHLNNSSSFLPAAGSPQRSIDQRSTASIASAPAGPTIAVNEEPNSLASSAAYHPDSVTSQNDSEEDNLNPTEKLQKLNEVRKRLNELRELVHYYEQTSDMMTDAVNENTKEEEETGESDCESEHENPQPVTNIRNPQGISNWGEINYNSNLQCGTNNRNGRHLNTSCEINNQSANVRMPNMPSTLDCHYNRKEDDVVVPQDDNEDIDAEADRISKTSLSSRRSSIADEGAIDAEFEQKINRLIAAKQKLKQLQNLVAMVQDDEMEPEAAGQSNVEQFFLAEEEKGQQQPNNIRNSANKSQKSVGLNEKAREKFYEAKLQQQKRELKHLQEERKKLINIQEKIQVLQKACPDLQLTSSLDNCAGNASTAAANEVSTVSKSPIQPEELAVDSETWSQVRKHEILREELRQRRKQLEALMAEHQRRQNLADVSPAAPGSVKSNGSETQCTPQQSRTEKTMATWGGSTQCALDEDEGDEVYLSDGLAQAEEEEEEQEYSSNEMPMCPNNVDQISYCAKEDKESWKTPRPLSADGNYRPLDKARQQQNISMRRQENHRWMSELSYVEEKEQWQEQINQLKKHLEFSVSVCQTLMQDQQMLSCLLQTLLTGPYSVMPGNVASPQVHLIMHQLNQCYAQLTWQQNNVQRLKQMLNNLMRQQEKQQARTPKEEKDNRAPPHPSPTVFCPFSFPSQAMNLFNMPGFTNFSSFPPGINLGQMFPSGDFSHNCNAQNSEYQPTLNHNNTGKADYMAFPKPFESNSTSGAENQRSQRQPEEEMENRSAWLNEYQEGGKEKQPFLRTGFTVPVQNAACSNHKNQPDMSRRREFDEESLESFSSMPDPVDPTTVTKTFKPRKASAQASLASKDKTPKSKNKRRSSSQFKKRPRANGFESASVSSTCEPYKSNSGRPSTRKEELVQAKVFSKKNREQLEKIIKYSRSSEMSSAHARRILQQSNRNACLQAPETGSDLSMFEALRDTIYSEVATLISQNESRPHFLIELFHELQMLNTDYLRQRALYALQDIVTRHASEDNMRGECPKQLNSNAWIGSNSELTPSESLATTDDETFAKNFDQGACRESEQNDRDNGSTRSTSSNFEPFATDDLGNTVIHLDQALARMREYERMKIAAEGNLESEDGCCSNLQTAPSSKLEGSDAVESHSAPQTTEVSSIPCPRIDTQQLDRQIKAIMKEVIPFLKEHMDEICTSQLLTAVKRMVLTLTQQNDESKEFVKIFHKQLGSILQDSLAKFAGKKLKDCGEDLLVEISEVLFNELAFFKLMQDLDNNSLTAKQKCKPKIEVKKSLEEGVCSSTEDIDEDKDKDETETIKQVHEPAIFSREIPISTRSDPSDQEEESENCPVSISLSKAETQALTNYGSGEDENEDEEMDEFEEGPVDVQTSLQANNETTAENEEEQISQSISENPNVCQSLSSEQDSVNTKDDQNIPAIVPQYLNLTEEKQSLVVRVAEDFNANIKLATEKTNSPLAENENKAVDAICGDSKSSSGTPESSVVGSPDTESPVLVNEYETGSGNVSQKSDEDDFVKLEDIPLKLAVYSEEELMKKMMAESQTNSITEEILAEAERQGEELVGDPQMLKQPEIVGAQSA